MMGVASTCVRAKGGYYFGEGAQNIRNHAVLQFPGAAEVHTLRDISAEIAITVSLVGSGELALDVTLLKVDSDIF